MRKLIAPAIGAIASVVLFAAPAADANSKWADVRVVTNDGTTLAEHRQYTDDVRVRASEEADCFGESNPSSNRDYKLNDPTVLGALLDAAKNDRDLRPVLITDAFFDDFGSFGVCEIGGVEPTGFSYWYSSVNGEGAVAGPNQIPVENGDRNVWYLTTGNEPGFPNELRLKSPTRVSPGVPFEVKVTRLLSDGSREPATGVRILGGSGGVTGPDGKAVVSVPAGKTKLRAEGAPDDIPSAAKRVCAAADLSDCPKRFGLKIRGSANPDEIRGTRGADNIKCGRGIDIVREAQKKDSIAKSCEKVRR